MVIQSRKPVANAALPLAIRRRLGNQGKTWDTEADTVLRDVAFVLKMTQRVREEILDDADRKTR